MSTRHLITASLFATLLLVGGAVFLTNVFGFPEEEFVSVSSPVKEKIDIPSINKKYEFEVKVGQVGSEHSHMSLVFYNNGEKIDFSKERYQLQSSLVHFEEGDGVTVHKHATGINLPFIFATLDIRINNKCFMFNILEESCDNEFKKLTFLVNGEKLQNIFDYELLGGDKILINYGDDNEDELRLKFEEIPNNPYQK